MLSVGVDGSFRVWDLEVGTCTVATKSGKPHGHLHLAGPDRVLISSRGSPRAVLMHPKGLGDTMRIDAGSPITACLVHPKVSSGVSSGGHRAPAQAQNQTRMIYIVISLLFGIGKK